MESFSFQPMNFGSEEDFNLAITELTWIKKNKNKISYQDYEGISVKYKFPIDFLKKGISGLTYPDDYKIATSKWFPIIYSWQKQKDEVSNKLKHFIVDYEYAKFQAKRTIILSIAIVIGISYIIVNSLSLDTTNIIALSLTFGTFLVGLFYQLMDPVSLRKRNLEEYQRYLKQKGLNRIVEEGNNYIRDYGSLIRLAGNVIKRKLDSSTIVISYAKPTVENGVLSFKDCEFLEETYKKRIQELKENYEYSKGSME